MTDLWINLAEHQVDGEQSAFQFWNGVNVYIDRPHLVNRKLLAAEIVKCFTIPISWEKLTAQNDGNVQNIMDAVLNDEVFNENSFRMNSELESNQTLNENESIACQVCVRRLIPRNPSKFSQVLELVIKDENRNVVVFWPKENDVVNSPITPTFPYKIKLEDSNRVIIQAYGKQLREDARGRASEEWLKVSVLPKVCRWSCFSPTTNVVPSLNLVSAKSYSLNHSYLKHKYAKKYIQIWTESSDPLKYVHEDIAIAAYLITLWEKERSDLNISIKQTFVDLGCGNGLLVDILSSEGYHGIGIDVRKRKIWDIYDKSTVLIEKAIEPSDYNVFPNYDWIIGNHSDELTPWIPVIAARSNYRMKVFLLPCCAYTFNGKYIRSTNEQTQYQSYLLFVRKVCESMGFVVQEDKLRIPSTKRLCFVCMSRNYKQEDESSIDSIRKEFIHTHSRKNESLLCTSKFETTNNSIDKPENISTYMLEEANWITDFKPRDPVEVVKNCSQLDRRFLDSTVLTVAKMLLETENYVCLMKGSEKMMWNSGGKIKFTDLIKRVDPQILKCMKNQCGGFQTFLRNHRNVFQIKEGEVQLNIPVKGIPLNSQPPTKKRKKRKQYNFKEKPCFFFFYHPQSCPLEDNDCNFSHQIIK